MSTILIIYINHLIEYATGNRYGYFMCRLMLAFTQISNVLAVALIHLELIQQKTIFFLIKVIP